MGEISRGGGGRWSSVGGLASPERICKLNSERNNGLFVVMSTGGEIGMEGGSGFIKNRVDTAFAHITLSSSNPFFIIHLFFSFFFPLLIKKSKAWFKVYFSLLRVYNTRYLNIVIVKFERTKLIDIFSKIIIKNKLFILYNQKLLKNKIYSINSLAILSCQLCNFILLRCQLFKSIFFL